VKQHRWYVLLSCCELGAGFNFFKSLYVLHTQNLAMISNILWGRTCFKKKSSRKSKKASLFQAVPRRASERKESPRMLDPTLLTVQKKNSDDGSTTPKPC
jgi:hypothetical protein